MALSSLVCVIFYVNKLEAAVELFEHTIYFRNDQIETFTDTLYGMVGKETVSCMFHGE